MVGGEELALTVLHDHPAGIVGMIHAQQVEDAVHDQQSQFVVVAAGVGGGVRGGHRRADHDVAEQQRHTVGVVVVVGGGSLLIITQFIPRLAVSPGKTISVVEYVYLGPRLTVHLVDVAGQRFLLSSTRDRISMLAEVAPPGGEGVEGQGDTSP